ncbi:MAG TPA: hypothetical protein VFV25_00795, partial [Methylibium sp.]
MQQPTPPAGALAPAPAPAPAARPALPRLAFFGRVLWFCAFPLATVVLGNLVLFEVDQAKEAMEAYFDAVSFRLSHLASFLIAYWAWAVSTWYCARLLLGRRFPVTAIGNCVGPVFAARLVKWLPRVLAVLSTLPTAIYLLVEGQWLVGVPVLVLALALLVFVVWRRSWPWAGRRIAAAFSTDAALGEQWEHFDRIDPIGKALLWLLGLGPWGVLAGLLLADPGFARTLGAPGLLLLALAAWTVFGSMVLIYWPLTRGWSAMVYVPLAMLLAFSFSNDNHVIGQREGVTTPNAEARPDVAADFSHWLKAQAAAGRGKDPIYLVAMSGGASRAAYWGAYTLGWLEDEARGAGRPFAADIYAISGVSGGSLGAAAFVTALASERAALQQQSGGHRATSLAGWMGELLG